jgi:hypothetical protein
MNDFIVPPRGGGHRPTFLTPDAAAAKDQNTSQTSATPSPAPTRKQHWYKRITRKQWIIIGVAAGVVVLGGGAVAYKMLHKSKPKPVVHTVVKPAPKPQSAPLVSNLTGLPIPDKSINDRPVTAVMIENSLDARPQSGLDQAGVVFEAVAEGGITRFLTLFQDSQPDYIGPVRSVRPYYIQWLAGFNAAVAHAGGSPEALNDLKAWGIPDLDQFANGAYYQRITSRYAPHNLYTSMDQLHQLESKKGIGAPSYTSLVRKKEAPKATPNAKSIDFNISGFYYNAHFDYDAGSNTYKRSEGGKPHMAAAKDGKQTQLAPKVVVALTMPQGIEADDLHTSYGTIGSGHAFIFQDGGVSEATWHKGANNEQFTFTDGQGKPIGLNPGQTWFTAVGSNDKVKYN